jgi:hypothetical protein
MRIVILSRTSIHYAPYHEWLKDLDAEKILLVNKERLATNGECTTHLESYFNRIEHIPNYDHGGLLERRVLELADEKPIDALISLSEMDIIRAAKLRTMLKIPGQKEVSALAYRDKVVMKDYAVGAGIDVAPYKSVDTMLDLFDFVRQQGLPVVLKPRAGAGSANTKVFSDQTEIESLAAVGLVHDFDYIKPMIVESFVSGMMHHVDGLLKDGDVVFSEPSIYTTGCLAFQNGGYLASHTLAAENPMRRRLTQFVSKVASALPAPDGIVPFHCEVFHTPDDRLVLCEIASRTGGVKVCEVTERVTGINTNREWVRASCGLAPKLVTSVPKSPISGWLVIPPQPRKLTSISSLCPLPGVVEYTPTQLVGKAYNNARTSVDNVAQFVLEAESETELETIIIRAVEWFTANASWSELEASPVDDKRMA